MEVSPDDGLNPSDVKSRRQKFGPNRLRGPETRSTWSILADQFQSLIVVLLAAALVSFLFGELVEGVAIAAVLLINAAIGFATEIRAVRSMEALQRLRTVEAVTVSFLTLAFAQLWHVYNMRAPGSAFLRNDVTENPFVWGAIALCTAPLLAAVHLPGLSDVLRTASPGPRGWAVVISMSLMPWAAGQVLKEVRGRQR